MWLRPPRGELTDTRRVSTESRHQCQDSAADGTLVAWGQGVVVLVTEYNKPTWKFIKECRTQPAMISLIETDHSKEVLNFQPLSPASVGLSQDKLTGGLSLSSLP